MKREIEIDRIPVISTAHIDEATDSILWHANYARDWFGVGWVILTHVTEYPTEVPQCIQDIWKWAYKKGFHSAVRLDPDAPIAERLPTYDW